MPSHENADPRRAVLILIDGARPDVLQTLLDRGDLPNLARWVIEVPAFKRLLRPAPLQIARLQTLIAAVNSCAIAADTTQTR